MTCSDAEEHGYESCRPAPPWIGDDDEDLVVVDADPVLAGERFPY